WGRVTDESGDSDRDPTRLNCARTCLPETTRESLLFAWYPSTPYPAGVHGRRSGPLPAPRPRRVRGCRHQRAHGEGVRCLPDGLSIPTNHIATAPFAAHWRNPDGERTRHRHLPRNG